MKRGRREEDGEWKGMGWDDGYCAGVCTGGKKY